MFGVGSKVVIVVSVFVSPDINEKNNHGALVE